MGLEVVTHISDFVVTNPVGATDLKSQGDDHIRNIKLGIKNTFPNIAGAMTATQTQLNQLASLAALSVIGVTGNAPAAPAAIAAGTDGHVLRRNGTALGFGRVENLGLRQGAAVSLIGRSANSLGDVADIDAAANDRIMRRVGNALDFGQTTEGMFANNTVPEAGFKYAQTAAELAASVTPTNLHYPVGHMFRYGIPTDGTSDCTPALNQAIAVAAQLSTQRRFYFPSIGTVYRFTTKPNNIAAAMFFYGDGRQTTLYRDYNGASPDEGLFNFRTTGEYFVVRDMSILSVSGRSGGCLISVMADASNNVAWGLLSNLRLTTTGTNTHNYGVYIDGSAKTVDPVGVRVMRMEGCEVFGGSLAALFIKSTMGFRASACNTFDAGGTSGKVVVTGTVGVPAYYTAWDGGFISGLDLSFCEQCNFNVSRISGNVDIAATAIDCTVIGHCPATVTDAGTYTTQGVTSLLHTRNVRADKLLVGGVTSSTHALEANGGITGSTLGTVTKIGHVGVAKDTVCPTGQAFTITTTNTLKNLKVATQGGAGCDVRGDFKTAALDLYDPSNEYENSAAPSAGQTGISKSANSHVITIRNNTGISITYSIISVGNISSVTDPA